MDIREQLDLLRRKVSDIDLRYGAIGEKSPPPPVRRAALEDLLTGGIVTTPHGRHFETQTFYPAHQRHGTYEISDLAQLSPGLLDALSEGSIPHAPSERWLFLDTETTGLAGGSGTCAFLVGAGSITPEGFHVRQFFMRDYDEEASLLHALAEHIAGFDVLITYNGRSYDQPLLETRFTMNRARHPFARLAHLDLLYGARRMFRLRLENCRLVNLENQILGFERQGDIPGEMIPYCYFEYLRTGRAHRLPSIFHHNVLDIVSLACLTGVIPEAFRDPTGIRVRHGVDLLGIARWLQTSGRLEEAHQLLRRAIGLGLPDEHLFGAIYSVGLIEKKRGDIHAALATFTDLSLEPNPYRAKAYEELARHYEHRERSFGMALECVRAARDIEDTDALRTRYERLRRKQSGVSRLKLGALN